jgi:hypothetical protein
MIEFVTGLVIGVCIGMFIMGMLAAERRQEEIGQLKKIIQEEL